uniref:EOG090X01XB n=1 Tax=Daphnia longispina TaxID=42846 RepID=A0A4Y7M8P9_9CRUS|nr:EOG090X01XB [Daphnia longispina]
MKIENQLDTKDTVPSDMLNGKEASTSGGPAGNLQVEEKRRRAWEQWSADDIAAFFEGLNEFGKDFDAIQNCLYTKNRKKSLVNSTNIKNKDQVRHFYYRTWHKISKYLLPTPDEGKRMHKELYGLINYGEMWKKLGGYFNDRCGEKLNELVQHGVTSVKIKGKSYRIKTPVCQALKRLQSPGTETQKLPSIPERIVMELTPCCNADFLRVQSVAHNPRIRISTDSSLPMSSIISFLTKKWKPRSILEAESAAEDELIMRITPDTRQAVSIGTSEGRLQLTYAWERRSKPEQDSDHAGRDVVSLLSALVNIAKSSLMKSQPSGEIFPVKKAARRQIIQSQPSTDGSSSEIGAPTQNLSIEQRLRPGNIFIRFFFVNSKMELYLLWLPAYTVERGDEISLSSLLNQLVSPAKSTASSRYTDLKLPFDLQSLVADNSVDLTAKFQELANSIAAADSNTSKNRP